MPSSCPIFVFGFSENAEKSYKIILIALVRQHKIGFQIFVYHVLDFLSQFRGKIHHHAKNAWILSGIIPLRKKQLIISQEQSESPQNIVYEAKWTNLDSCDIDLSSNYLNYFNPHKINI